MAEHLPVLRTTAIDLLALKPGDTCVDATVGLGGHANEIAKWIGEEGRLIGIDQDRDALEIAKTRISGCRLELIQGNFSNLENLLKRNGIGQVDAVLADIGVSSLQLDTAERGFSFRAEGPLDMRMDASRGQPAWQWMDRMSEQDLAKVFWEYGEENSRRIAKAIVHDREKNPIRTTTQLAELIRAVVGRPRGSGFHIDPATRVFQALRIAVNDELGSLDAFLEQLRDVVKPGGRAAVICFHSLEDRRVKNAFRNANEWTLLTKKPAVPTQTEISENPRSRSAKLRAAMRCE